MSTYILSKKIIIEGFTVVKTGLHIGGTNNSMSIGGMDNAVVRNPVNNEPYIPGSSLKGKMRSLLEIAYGYVKRLDRKMGKVEYHSDDNPKYITTKLFGNASGNDKQRPSKIIVRDGGLANKDELGKTDLPYTEAKTEVVIDRITSAAMPRQLERVPAGAKFDLSIVLNVIKEDEDDHEEELVKNLFKGLQLVQDDYLGGSGSRGSGQVEFVITRVIEKDADYYRSGKGDETLINKAKSYQDEKGYIPKTIRVDEQQAK